jgi:hypothetical protein
MGQRENACPLAKNGGAQSAQSARKRASCVTRVADFGKRERTSIDVVVLNPRLSRNVENSRKHKPANESN